MADIFYTCTDESPRLATASLLPIVTAFARHAQIDVVTADISLTGRIIAAFSDTLPTHLRHDDDLTRLGKLAQNPAANIVKLPNISASVPQLTAAIAELQDHGYPVPDYPTNPQSPAEQEIRARYDSIKGSAVNPVLREGNSDRRVAQAVKNYARSHPHEMAAWSPNSQTFVATMNHGDFKHNEVSVVVENTTHAKIIFTGEEGQQHTINPNIALNAGDIIDASVLEAHALDEFLTKMIQHALDHDMLFSLHLKATMMKVSDPVIFGHALRAFFPQTYARYGAKLHEWGLAAENGLGTIFAGLAKLDTPEAQAVRASFDKEYTAGPRIAMVNSQRGITNLHVPSDVIVDASMPAMIRNGGQMWGPAGEGADTVAVIPDSSYAPIYQATIDDCRRHGAFNPATMGTVANVGLMAQKAEEYGSHDKTWVADADGTVTIVTDTGNVLATRQVHAGDIFRSCLTRKVAIENWVQLALQRARLTGTPVIFWLDSERAHDQHLISYVQDFLNEQSPAELAKLDIQILDLPEATQATLARIRAGADTISATGNVLRDYLTDLFPIMELGTSAKMLSVVPLMAGGGLFETGAGGSAPKLAEQLFAENHLSWDSLGEFLALAESFRHAGRTTDNPKATILAHALDNATERWLDSGLSVQPHAGERDTRATHALLATYWAEELARQESDCELREAFAPVAKKLAQHSAEIQQFLVETQGQPVDLGGYYHPDVAKLDAVMRPCAIFNEIVSSI